MTQLIRTAALTVDFSKERHELLAKGALSRVVQPVLDRMNDRLRVEKPAMVREMDVVATTWLPPIPSGPFKRLILNEAKMAIGRPVPQTVSIEVTRECGCRCDHCNIGEGEEELEGKDIERVIDEALDLGACIITFTEGDPLLREDIFDLIAHVDPELAVTNLFTPGIEMTPDIARRLKNAGLYNLLVGIYSTDSNEHDRVRGVEGAFEKAISAIRCALNEGLMVTMTTHVTSKGINQLPDLYDLAKDLGVHEFSIWEGIPRDADDILSQIDREKIMRLYQKANSSRDGPRVFASTFFEGQMMGCMAGRRWQHVAVDGSVRGCPYLKESYGNVLDLPLKEIWKRMRASGDFDGFEGSCPAQELS
ncbi:MAG: radical SAM protein [Methanotrichaceae archaeon]|nr:radical SAM protein [Methanotrichaceae archaeon]